MRVSGVASILVIACTCIPCGGAWAQGQDDVRRVNLAEALGAFAENSLELRIARSEAEEAAGHALQLRAYANPAFSLVREDLGRAGRDYWETTAGVVQQVEWPARTAARSRVVARTIDGLAARFRADSTRFAFSVREAYVRAWFAEEAELTAARAASVIGTVAEVAERRLAEGDISAYEARRLRLERVAAEQQVAESAFGVRRARRALGALIAPQSDAYAIGPSEAVAGLPPAVTMETALEALAERPDVEAAERHLDAARARSAVAATAWVPDPTLGLGYKDQADGFSGAAVTVNVPLPVFDRGAAARLGTLAGESAAAHRLDLSRRLAEIDLRAASDRYAFARSRLEAVGEALLTEADALLATASTSFEEGEMTLVELLDAAGTFRETRLSVLSLRSETWIAYFDLLRAMGRSPEDGGSWEDRP